jgi:hypothetical protein
MQPPPPPSIPPKWSPDGQWWWDGSRWWPRVEVAPAPGYFMVPPVPTYTQIALTPSPGLRIFLIVVLVIATYLTGGFALFGLLGVAGGAHQSSDLLFFGAIVVLFAITAAALVGVAMQARWSRWAAIAAGIALSLTCLGLILGLPILIAASRAPDLRRQLPT